PGVAAVSTCDELGALDRPLPLLIPHPSLTEPRTQLPLARGEVFYVGQTIAMVVAESRYLAEDALELIELELEPLPVVVDVERAVAADARVHADVPGNTAAHFVEVVGDPDAGFARADVVVAGRYVLERSAG